MALLSSAYALRNAQNAKKAKIETMGEDEYNLSKELKKDEELILKLHRNTRSYMFKF